MEKISHTDLIEILKKVSLFSELNKHKDAFETIAQIMTIKIYPENFKLIEQGAPGTEVFILLKGKVAVYKNNPEGGNYKVAILNSENHPFFGEGGLIEGELRSATIECEEKCECLVLTKDNFNQLCSANPEVGLPILKRVAQSLITRLNQTSNDLMLLHKALMSEIRSV